MPILIGESRPCCWAADGRAAVRGRGVGRALLERAIKDAKAKGHRLILLVGDEVYYSRVGSRPCRRAGRACPSGRLQPPFGGGARDGAFTGVSGAIRPDWSMAR